MPAVVSSTGLQRTTIYKRMAEGTVPRSIPLGGRIVGWSENEINQWIDEQKGARDEAATDETG